MVQQVNLLTPILLTPKRLLSAATMLQAFALLLAATLALGLWLSLQAQASRQAFKQTQERGAAELQSLSQALASLPPPVDPQLLAQQLSQLEQTNQAQARLLSLLRGGLAAEGWRHSDLLKYLAQTVPPSVWLASLRWQSGHLELQGATLDPVALRTWLERLAGKPLLAGLELGTVRVEKWSAEGPPASDGNEAAPGHTLAPPGALQSAGLPKPRAGQAVWSFRVVSELPLPPTPTALPGRTP
ncbi:Tfp pilus assembly protein PilN [Paucibacter oligotrophus]|uniref:Tfp pilus assembly protein PilN n=1 Tax=Roseateles oligotrophus TaxID=1769250 RepID=A0A840L4U9_9BURK|nr:PilN domain-containing protein [Roseateles oligotrophus]MBB4841555.1 Tfp pilus assembly protein PilN [Roseateles oligotrophus]